MLFGTVEAPGTPADDDPGQQALRLCALNVNSAGPTVPSRCWSGSPGRGATSWCSPSCALATAVGSSSPGWKPTGSTLPARRGGKTGQYMAVVASRGFETAPVTPAPFDPRVAAVDLAAAGPQPVRVVGVYAPTNGMTAESSLRRRGFQDQFLDYLAAITRPAMCVTATSTSSNPGTGPPWKASRTTTTPSTPGSTRVLRAL